VNPCYTGRTSMRRLFLSLAAIWAALGTALVTISTDFASDWLKHHPSLKDIEGLVRPHLLLGIALLGVLGSGVQNGAIF
jgi:hypothetical protein